MADSKDNSGLVKKEQTGFTPELLKRFLDLQEKDLENKAKEHELKIQSDNHAYDYSCKGLEAQTKDRQEGRDYSKSMITRFLIFAGGGILLLGLLLGFCIFMGKEAIALEIVKAIIIFGGGALGGYGYANSKKKSEDKSD